MIPLTSTRSILHLDGPAVGMEGVRFARIVDEPDEPQRHVSIDADLWDELGKPETITVTIEPGDLLNT